MLYLGGLFSPGLLDDVDSVYIEVAREMLQRHDYVTPMVDGIRFFDKPPLLYWLAAGSMRLFGVHDWAARLPLALLTLGLLLATYALALRLFAAGVADEADGSAPACAPDRAALYSALAVGTSVGPYLYTRFYIPDIALALWMTLAVHLLLHALDRVRDHRSTLVPALLFGTVTALAVLSKGLIGLVFPVLFAVLFAALSGRLTQLRGSVLPAGAAFLLTAAPWHTLAARRNPPIPMPALPGLPARAGWAWFYLYNEHVARFFSRRIPHDYGQVPLLLFWLLAAVWLAPWAAFLPEALAGQVRALRLPTDSPRREAALALLLWAAVILVFFSLSARQEYYSLPAVPAFALAIGALLARADQATTPYRLRGATTFAHSNAHDQPGLHSSALILLPLGSIAAVVALYFALSTPSPAAGTDISTLLSAHGDSYNLSLDHLFDLSRRAMGAFRLPLLLFAGSMFGIGPVSYALRRARRSTAANGVLAVSAVVLLLSMHGGLVRFYPVLGSKQLAAAIVADQARSPRAGDLIVLDGELTTGSTLLFYTRQPVSMLDARVNGPWFGSFWPDSPPVFETTASLHARWEGPRRIYLLTYHPQQRTPELQRFGPVDELSSAGGKAILVNRPPPQP